MYVHIKFLYCYNWYNFYSLIYILLYALYLYIYFFSFFFLDEARSEATFRYTVENISKMKDSQLSPACYVRNLPWKIMVMPRSSQTQERQPQRSLGFFLQCNGESESTSWSCYAVAELRLLSCKEGQELFSRSKYNSCSLIFFF